ANLLDLPLQFLRVRWRRLALGCVRDGETRPRVARRALRLDPPVLGRSDLHDEHKPTAATNHPLLDWKATHFVSSHLRSTMPLRLVPKLLFGNAPSRNSVSHAE